MSKPIMLRLPDTVYTAYTEKARKMALPVATLIKSLLVQMLEKERPVLGYVQEKTRAQKKEG